MLDQARKDLCIKLIDECNVVFSESIKKKVTFSDAHTFAYWGERPKPELWFDEPWTNWKEIPEDILDRCSGSVLYHVPFKDVLFYLVAYMRFTLKSEIEMKFFGCYDTETLSIIGQNYERLDELGLTDRQKLFFREFIKYFMHDPDSRDWINLHRKIPFSKSDFL